jgi:hypothetical protein
MVVEEAVDRTEDGPRDVGVALERGPRLAIGAELQIARRAPGSLLLVRARKMSGSDRGRPAVSEAA